MNFYIRRGISICGVETHTTIFYKEKNEHSISIFAAHYLSLSTTYNLLQDSKLGIYS